MHPIEHLRYVARARGADPADLAREAAMALASLRADHANLVVASRRIVQRHPDAGQLWWLCAQLLVAEDPSRLAWELAGRLADDPVTDALARSIPDDVTVVTIGNPSTIADALVQREDVRVLCADSEFGAGDLIRRLDRAGVECEPISTDALPRALASADAVLIQAAAACPGRVLARSGSQVLAAVARTAATPVWLVAGTGTRLPPAYVDEVARRALDGEGWETALDDLPVDLIDVVVDERGPSSHPAAALRPDCALAPELLRPGVV